MPRVFISYRRTDTITISGRIYDRMVAAFGEPNVFKDVDNIPIGHDFRAVLHYEVGKSDVLLLVIGPGWVNASDEQGQRRLDDPNDFVRIEAETALTRDDILLIPVIVQGASVPKEAQLPPSLRELPYLNAAFVRDDPDFNHDIKKLIEHISRNFAHEQAAVKVQSVQAEAAPLEPPVQRAPTINPADDFDFDFDAPVSPPSGKPTFQKKQTTSNTKYFWWVVGAIVLLLFACFACQLLSSQMSYSYYGY